MTPTSPESSNNVNTTPRGAHESGYLAMLGVRRSETNAEYPHLHMSKVQPDLVVDGMAIISIN